MTPRAPSPPSHRSLPALCAWAGLVLGALLFLVWIDALRLARIRYVTDTASWSVDASRLDPSSPTGYAGQRRQLIVPGQHNLSYGWIMQTQQLVGGGNWREHHFDHDNFPAGRESSATSPYRWWLASVAWLDHASSSRSLPLAVEHAALYADPLLQVLLILSVALFAGIRFGGLTAAASALALVTLFPLAGGFQPGAPDHHALAWLGVLWSLLLLLAGALGEKPSRWFALAGAAGGLALWTDHLTGEPIVAGIALGAAGAIWLGRRAAPLPWRAWGLAGGLTCLLAWLLEYFPARPDWTVASIHPLHAVAWLGLGELLHRTARWAQTGRAAWDRRAIFAGVAALLALAALPTARILSTDGHFLAADAWAGELANLATGTRAPSLAAWLDRDGLTPAFGALCLSLLPAGLALQLVLSRKTPLPNRCALAVVLGPGLVALALACRQLRWWNAFDAVLVVLVIAMLVTVPRRRLWAATGLLLALPGCFLLAPRAGSRGTDPLGNLEVQAVVERDLAHWLAHQQGAGRAAIFTTPGLTETFAYYANLGGVASYDPENREGFSATARIASASTWAEASALLEGRAITHLVLPSWDATLVRFAQLGRQLPPDAGLPRNTLIANLQNWNLPPWLRLMTYHSPQDLGSEQYTVRVLALQGAQDELLATCRMADYFIELGLLEEARALRDNLRLHPRSVPALAALVQIDQAIGDSADHATTLATLLPYVSRRGARVLPVDRRITLSALLLQANQRDAAREQMQLCGAEMNPERLRELTTGGIVRLLALNDILGLALPDPQLRPLALSLLPPILRTRLVKPTDANP